ncbi:MAG: hypothetical protein KL785_01910 [Brevundimonas sp.]|nr:hypothetical protein [Brevundimonas sp.]
MGRTDELLDVIEAIHAAGLEAGRWPDALRSVSRMAGASAASLETYDYARRSHRMWHGYGSEPEMIEAYLSFHSSDNVYAPDRTPPAGARKFPRGPHPRRGRAGPRALLRRIHHLYGSPLFRRLHPRQGQRTRNRFSP